MGFNDWINVEPAPMSALDRIDEVDRATREKLATKLQSALRTSVDAGADLGAALRAQKIKVVADESRFVLEEEDQGEVLNAPDRELPASDPNEVDSVDELFKMSNGVPSVTEDGRLVYRSITSESLLGQQHQAARRQHLEHTVADTLRNNFVESFEEAVSDIDRRK